MNHLTAQRKEITKFILMTFLWSWFFWIGTAILTTQNAIKQGQFFYRVFHILGGSGPTIIALYFAIAKKPKGSLRAFSKPGYLVEQQISEF